MKPNHLIQHNPNSLDNQASLLHRSRFPKFSQIRPSGVLQRRGLWPLSLIEIYEI